MYILSSPEISSNNFIDKIIDHSTSTIKILDIMGLPRISSFSFIKSLKVKKLFIKNFYLKIFFI
jgi:hypothetical protein